MSDNFRILIVDDDYRMAKTLRDILIIKGYETDLAHSGSEALEKVEETYYTCILSDIKMPEVNGVELYRAIKKIEPDLPVVLMTAYSHDKLIKKGLGYDNETILICGMALGYEDKEDPVNNYHTPREDITAFTQFFD